MTTTVITQIYDGTTYIWHIWDGKIISFEPLYLMSEVICVLAVLFLGLSYLCVYKEINANIRSLFKRTK